MRKIKYRKLIPDDRVIITGHWSRNKRSSPRASGLIGKHATVINVHKHRPMPIEIRIDGLVGNYSWIRENLRAIPRTKKLVLGRDAKGQVKIEK